MFLLVPVAAYADPISIGIFIAESLLSVGVEVGAASIALGYIGAAALTIGASVAINAGSALLQKALGNSAAAGAGGIVGSAVSANTAELRTTSRVGIVNREMVLGTVLKAGNLFFEAVKGPYLYRGYILAPHNIEGVTRYYIGSSVVPVDTNGNPVQPPYLAPGKQYLRFSTRLGTTTQAIDTVITTDFPSLNKLFEQRGIATTVVKLYRGADANEAAAVWGQNDPQPLFLVKGKKFYDPRDPTQSITDSSTWKWTCNAALCTAGWLNDQDGQNVSWADISIPYLIAAANVCDQKVQRRDGTFENRYEVHGVVDTSSDPATAFQNLLLSMLGEYTIIDGQYALVAGAPRDAIRTLTEASARGNLDVSIDRLWGDTINTVRTSFVAKNRDYTVSTGPIYQDATALAADNGIEKSISLDLRFVISDSQVQRIAKHLIQRSRLGCTIQRDEDIEAWRLTPTDIVQIVYSGALSTLNRLFEVTRITDSNRLDEFTLQMIEYDAAKLFGWNPAVDERDWSQATINVS